MELNDAIDSIDIVDFISQYVELTERNGEFWGLSPFKEEKTPSFSVRREKGRFYDFSSGLNGGVLIFVENFFKCDYRKAVNILKEYLQGLGQDITFTKKMSAVTVCKKYKQKNNTEPRKDLSKDIIPDDYMNRYEFSRDKLSVWEAEGISANTLKKFEVKYDRYSNRLVYPIRNCSGRIVNIGGRTLDPNYKDRGLKKYCYFFGWADGMNLIYNFYSLNSLDDVESVILFEGCKSVMLAYEWGIQNTGAILTSHLNMYQMKLLAKYGKTVVFALDKDIDIRKDKHIQSLKKYVNVEYIYDAASLLDEKDSPVDKGKEVFLRLYNERRKLK